MNKKEEYIDLKKEDIIWIIYYIIVTAQIYSNYMQEKNIINNKTYSMNRIRNLNLTILIIVFFIYFYFFYKSLKDLYNNIRLNNTKKIYYSKLNTIANIMFLTAGLIFIYIEYNNKESEDEIGII